MTNSNKTAYSVRLQKYLAELGVSSRREADRLISEGKVKVNGKVAKPGIKVIPGEDAISVMGKLVDKTAAPKVYWLLNKPDMTLCSRQVDGDKDRIYDLPELTKIPFHVFSVGRLDYRTEGLLLVTNDGELSEKLTHPKYAVERTYQVLISGKLSKDQEKQIREGFDLEDGFVKPTQLLYGHGKNLGKSRGSWYFLSLKEGRNRVVRRIFEHFDLKVVRLIRVNYGPIELPEDLPPGSLKALTAEQIRALKNA